MKKNIIIIFVLFIISPVVSMAFEGESSVMQGKIRATVGGLPPPPAPTPQANTNTQPAAPVVNNGQMNPYMPPFYQTGTAPMSTNSPSSAFPQPDAKLEPTPVPANGATSPDNSPKVPTESEISQAVQKYVLDNSRNSGTFEISDPQSGKTRKLNFMMVDGSAQQLGNIFRTTAKFQDLNSGEIVDADFDIQAIANQVNVINVGISKINGEAHPSVNNPNVFTFPAGAGQGLPVDNQNQSSPIFRPPAVMDNNR